MLLREVPTMTQILSEIQRHAMILRVHEKDFLSLCLLKVETEAKLKRLKPVLANLRKELLEACL